jgi:hypothetical protein
MSDDPGPNPSSIDLTNDNISIQFTHKSKKRTVKKLKPPSESSLSITKKAYQPLSLQPEEYIKRLQDKLIYNNK